MFSSRTSPQKTRRVEMRQNVFVNQKLVEQALLEHRARFTNGEEEMLLELVTKTTSDVKTIRLWRTKRTWLTVESVGSLFLVNKIILRIWVFNVWL